MPLSDGLLDGSGNMRLVCLCGKPANWEISPYSNKLQTKCGENKCSWGCFNELMRGSLEEYIARGKTHLRVFHCPTCMTPMLRAGLKTASADTRMQFNCKYQCEMAARPLTADEVFCGPEDGISLIVQGENPLRLIELVKNAGYYPWLARVCAENFHSLESLEQLMLNKPIVVKEKKARKPRAPKKEAVAMTTGDEPVGIESASDVE